MGTESIPVKQLRLDECNHVEKPLLDQFAGSGGEVIDRTDMKQVLANAYWERSTEVVVLAVSCKWRKVINWLEDNQVEEGVKPLAGE